MTIHVLRVPTEIYAQRDDGVRWCFYCRKRVPFTFTAHRPTDPMSYYGPHFTIECENGHGDGDCFPGTWREWSDEREHGEWFRVSDRLRDFVEAAA